MQGCKQRLFTKYPPIFSFYPDCENWLEGKAASRGADKKMCTPVLFIFTLIARLQAEVVQQISSSLYPDCVQGGPSEKGGGGGEKKKLKPGGALQNH